MRPDQCDTGQPIEPLSVADRAVVEEFRERACAVAPDVRIAPRPGDHAMTDYPGGPYSVCGKCGDPPAESGCYDGRCRATCGDCPPGGCGPHCDPMTSTNLEVSR